MTVRKDIASSFAVIVFGIVFLIYSSRYPLDSWASPGPGVFPMATGGVLLLLGIWQLLHSIWRWRRMERTDSPRRDEEEVPGFFSVGPGGRAALSLTAGFVLYVLGIRWIGYFLSTFLFAFFTSRLSGAKDFLRPALLSAGVCLFCYLVFVSWLKISFPAGLLF